MKKNPIGDEQDVQVKLQSLEEMVRRLREAMNIRTEPPNYSPFEMSAVEALTKLQISSSPETSLGNAPNSGTGWREASESRSSPFSEQLESFDEAPLLSLFQEAMLIQKHHVQLYRTKQEFSSDDRTKTYTKAIKALIPNSNDLDTILQMTEKFWPIWEESLNLIVGPEPHSITGIPSAKKFILDSMKSETPVFVAKSSLFLALCVQQLPISFKNQETNLPAAPNILLDAYIRGAESLISVNERGPATIDSLECMNILVKLYLNMGKPREAWHCVRRALNSALLLGLHNADDTAPQRQKDVRGHIWQIERHLSALLGLPSATTDSHPGVSTPSSAQNVGKKVLFDISVIAGHIIERNQNHQTANYAVTLAIDQEIQQCKSRMPPEWWNSIPTASTPLTAIYSLGILKIEFYAGQKMLHLPYMFKSSPNNNNDNNNYEYSRLQALDACREMIKGYQAVRQHPELKLAICDLMDFQAFTAAVVLVIDLLNQSAKLETHQEASDWDLVHDVTKSLKLVSETMECTVAGQALHLLEHLSTFREGAYEGPENYEAIIPMFGRVRINRPRTRKMEPATSSLYQSGYQFEEPFMPTVEISANSFAPFGMAGDILSEAELGIDWTSVMNVDYNYDWSKTFDGSLFG
jgi:hypothetical protein